MVDYILGVSDPMQWHFENLKMNSDHYASWMVHLGGARLVNVSQFPLEHQGSDLIWGGNESMARDKNEEALLLAQLSAEKPHFSHCLEWFLFTVFDAEISRRNPNRNRCPSPG